jgi:glucosyl-dolichyl phosphate glucuronosyltransferase
VSPLWIADNLPEAMRISVLIATWNRCDLLRQTLASLPGVRTPAGVEVEVLVCDNNSTDRTREVVESHRGTWPVRYLFEGTQGKSHALNRLIAESKGEWLLFVDDDVQADAARYSSSHAAIARYPKAGVFGGSVGPWAEGRVSRGEAWLMSTFPWVFSLVPVPKDTPMVWPAMAAGPNMALRREAIPPEGFDTRKGMIGSKRVGGEDTFICEAVIKRGYEGWLLAGPKVAHYVPRARRGLKWFCKWHIAGGGAWLVDRGRAHPGWLGLHLWAWRIVALRLFQATKRRLTHKRQAYEIFANALLWIGYIRASRAQGPERQPNATA